MNARRRFLTQTLAFTLTTSLGCRRARTQGDVLAALVRERTVPDTTRILRAFDELADTTQTMRDRSAVEAALREAIVAFQAAYAFRVGPMVESHALLRAGFWPARVPALRSLLEDGRPLDDRRVRNLGVDAKGLFAMEQLLFEAPGAGEPRWLSGPLASRAKALLPLLAKDARDQVQRAAQTLGHGDALAEALARDARGALDRLTNELLATLETASASRIQRVLDLARAEKPIDAAQVQGAPSGLSAVIPVRWVEVSCDLYERNGRGLCELVAQSAPDIDVSMRAHVERARKAMARLDAPLERLVQQDRARLEDAVSALKSLEVAVKVELASALGVTLTFTSSDGD